MKNPFRHPTYQEVVAKDLEAARLGLLAAESELEMAQARVQMYTASVGRLSLVHEAIRASAPLPKAVTK